VIVVMTSRAGARNHLYLVPENTKYRPEDIRELSGYQQSSPEKGRIMEHRTVSQSSTGRPGQETVAVYDPAIEPRHFDDIQRELDDFATSFEKQVLETLAEHSADTSRVVQHPELTRLEARIVRILGKPAGERTATKLRSAKKLRWGLLVVSIVVALVVVAALVVVYQNFGTNKNGTQNGQRNGSGNGNNGAIGKRLTDSELEALDSILRAMKKNPTPGKQLEQVDQAFREVLLKDDSRKLSTDPKKRLKENLQFVLRYSAVDADWRKATKLKDLLAMSEEEIIKKLYSSGKLNRRGLMEDKSNKFELDDAKASEFSKVITHLEELLKLLKSDAVTFGGQDVYSKFFSLLKDTEFPKVQGIVDDDRSPLFFPTNTTEILESVVGSLCAESDGRDLTKLKENLDGVEFLEKLKAERLNPDSFIYTAQLARKQKEFPESSLDKKAFKYLDKFFESLCDLVD